MPFVQHLNCLIAIGLALAVTAAPQAIAEPAKAPPMKPTIAGFIDMQTIAWHNADAGAPTFTLDNVSQFPGMFGGIVLNATWAELQEQGGGALTTTRIDHALEQVRAYNVANPTAPLGVKNSTSPATMHVAGHAGRHLPRRDRALSEKRAITIALGAFTRRLMRVEFTPEL